MRPTDNKFVKQLAQKMVENPFAVVAPWVCIVICSAGMFFFSFSNTFSNFSLAQLQKYKKAQKVYDVQAICKKEKVYVIEGNHSYLTIQKV